MTSGEGLYFGHIAFRTEDRLVHVTWGDVTWDDVDPDVAQAEPDARAGKRPDSPGRAARGSGVLAPGERVGGPGHQGVCAVRLLGLPTREGRGLGLSRVLALLPPAAEALLRAQENTPGSYTILGGRFPIWCSELTNEEARALERILDAAGVNGWKDVFGLTYGAPGPGEDAMEFSLTFNPILPDQR